MSRESKLAHTMVLLADSLVEDFDVVDLLTLLTDRCVEVLDVSTAGLILVVDGELRLMASSSEAMKTLELFELQADEGPCMDCYRAGAPIVNLDLASVEARSRWPRFAPEALDAGFRSAHAVPMRLRGTILGALNLFRTDAGEWAADDVVAAQAFADIATIAILQNRATVRAQVLNEQLNRALTSRIVIEQAKGVLAERGSFEMDEAFDRLRRYARNNNRRLVDVAQEVIDGVLATADLAPRR
jgi:GAF domain-containing protein